MDKMREALEAAQRIKVSHMDYAKLTRLLRYDPSTGEFTWLVNSSARVLAGTVAGRNHNGYIVIRHKRIDYLAHRLAWFYVHGRWPRGILDHINRDRRDNRISNLREADDFMNAHNASIRGDNTSGVKGVTFNKRRQTWEARIKFHNKRYSLGSFKTIEEAATARRVGEQKFHSPSER